MNQNALIHKLNQAEVLANGSIVKRLQAAGLKYFGFQWHKRVTYPLTQKGKIGNTKLFFDQKMKVKLPAGSDLYLLGAKTHTSEIRLAKFLINHLKKGMHFVDIGAHFGYFSLLASRLIGSTGKVISMEASTNVYNILKANTENLLQNTAINAAAGALDGRVSFYDYPLLYSEYNTIEEDQYNNESWNKSIEVQKTEVDMYSLKTLIKAHNILPSIIKIDVEGAEAKVLQGLDLNTDQKPIIIFEYIKEKPQEGLKEVLKKFENKYELRLMSKDGLPGQLIDLSSSKHQESFMDSENLILFPR